jgi:NADP-dependent 3-hydroxy acid dehydrogenase YdfG
MTLFTDQVAVVTGASSGIGKAIALGLGAQGARLCLVGRQLETLEAVAATAPTSPRRIECYRADLTQHNDIRELVRYLKRDFRYVDVLVHSAGVLSLNRLDSGSVKEFDWQYRTNVRAPYALTQALLPMLRVRQGQVVFINSSLGLNARANTGQYAATKHALKAIADSLRDEVNTDGLRVLSVFLGRTATPMQEAVHKMEGRPYHPERLMQPDDVAAVVIHALGVPRSVEVTDIHIRPLQKPI